jgi:anti-sigma B factor antagonist
MMTYSISTGDDGVTRFVIEGELDRVTVTDLRGEIDRLLGQRPSRVEIDLGLLRSIDSAGVGALVFLYKGVRAQGGDAVVIGLRDQPLAIFKLLRLDTVLVGPSLRK